MMVINTDLQVGSEFPGLQKPSCWNNQKKAEEHRFEKCPACNHLRGCKCENKGDADGSGRSKKA